MILTKPDHYRWHPRFALFPKDIGNDRCVWLGWYEWRWDKESNGAGYRVRLLGENSVGYLHPHNNSMF